MQVLHHTKSAAAGKLLDSKKLRAGDGAWDVPRTSK